MLFHIKHNTRYSYSRTVYCEPFTIRLRPREDSAQRLVRHQLSIDPEPAGRSEFLDLDGSAASLYWFSTPTCSLTIRATSVVETLRSNPFDFLLDSGGVKLPVQYRAEHSTAIEPYRIPAQSDGALRELAETIKNEAESGTIEFLMVLSRWIAENIQQTVRATGDPLPAESTFAERGGSCRDLAVLFAEVCRNVGLAARFVSGYQARPEDDGQCHLHAWTEVFLPGAGWRGFDPAQGLAVADQHVALAAALHPRAAAQTTGTFRGTDVASTLESQVVIRLS